MAVYGKFVIASLLQYPIPGSVKNEIGSVYVYLKDTENNEWKESQILTVDEEVRIQI